MRTPSIKDAISPNRWPRTISVNCGQWQHQQMDDGRTTHCCHRHKSLRSYGQCGSQSTQRREENLLTSRRRLAISRIIKTGEEQATNEIHRHNGTLTARGNIVAGYIDSELLLRLNASSTTAGSLLLQRQTRSRHGCGYADGAININCGDAITATDVASLTDAVLMTFH